MISKEEFLSRPAQASSSSRHGSGHGSRHGSGHRSRHGSATDIDAKADLAFKVFDKNRDGFVTKEEMLQSSKHLTKKQVSLKLFLITHLTFETSSFKV